MQLNRINNCLPVHFCFWSHALPVRRGWCVGVCKAPKGANVGDIVRFCTYLEVPNIKQGNKIARERGIRMLCLSVKKWPRLVDSAIYQAPIEMEELAAALLQASSVGNIKFPKDVEAHRKIYVKMNTGRG